jgi:hypothetical protein
MTSSKLTCVGKYKSKIANFDAGICQALECSTKLTKCIQMKVGNNRLIEIWACEVCSKN